MLHLCPSKLDTGWRIFPDAPFQATLPAQPAKLNFERKEEEAEKKKKVYKAEDYGGGL